MIPIFNSQGKTVGWIDDNVIIDRFNKCRAFIKNKNIFSYTGKYLGEFKNGFFWDLHGKAVAFIKGASNGPLTPITEIPPIPPIPPIPAISPIPQIPPIPPIHSLSWSQMTFNDFLSS